VILSTVHLGFHCSTAAIFSTSGVLVSTSYFWASSHTAVSASVFLPPGTTDSTTACIFYSIGEKAYQLTSKTLLLHSTVSSASSLSAAACTTLAYAVCEISSDQEALGLGRRNVKSTCSIFKCSQIFRRTFLLRRIVETLHRYCFTMVTWTASKSTKCRLSTSRFCRLR
jgi:hypothetical protein